MSLVYNRQYKDDNLDMKLINIFITNAHTVSTSSYLFCSSVDIFLCNGWKHYVPYRCLQISNKLCDSTLCTCGGVGEGREEQMHNVDYDPGPWTQTLRLPPPGIEPGSHASQAGTLPKELSRQLIPVLRSLIFTYPGSRIPDPGSKNSNKREG